MSYRAHAIVWIEHSEAEVFILNAKDETKLVINSHTSAQRLHHQRHPDAGTQQPVDTEFYHRVVSALNHTAGILITGPGEARYDLERYLKGHRPDLAANVHRVDTTVHPGDAGLVALARQHFQIAA